MEPKFQTSFIPKKPIVATRNSPGQVIQSTNIISLVANVIFVITLMVLGGLFFYKNLLNKQVIAKGIEVEAARDAFKVDEMQELIDINSRLKSTNDLLNKHVAVSKILVFLQEVTVKKVRFDEFAYKNPANVPQVSMKAEATTFNALAAQGDIFAKSSFIKSPYFKDYSLGDNGLIKASFFSLLDPTQITYKSTLGPEAGAETSSAPAPMPADLPAMQP